MEVVNMSETTNKSWADKSRLKLDFPSSQHYSKPASDRCHEPGHPRSYQGQAERRD